MNLAKKIYSDFRIPSLAVLIFVAMSFANPFFFTRDNMYGLFSSMPSYGITAIGLTFVMLCGQLDISIGSVMALSACSFMLMLAKLSLSVWVALPLTLLLGALCGSITGFFISSFRLQPFIVSMTMQLIYRGIALLITNSTPISLQHPFLMKIDSMLLGPVPVTIFVLLLVVILAQFVLRKTQFGRNLYIIGGNISAADNLGINVRKHLWSVYIIQGFLASLAAIVMLTRSFSASGNLAMDAPFSVIPVVIVGGTSFSGGRGDALATFFGLLLMDIIYNSMSMFNMHASMQTMVKGLVLLLIIVGDKYMENRGRKV